MDIIEDKVIKQFLEQDTITPQELQALTAYRKGESERAALIINKDTEEKKNRTELFKAIVTGLVSATSIGVSAVLLGKATDFETNNNYTSSMGKGVIRNLLNNLRG